MTYSQNNEEDIIQAVFKGKANGRFIDIGAGDGVTFSNTKMLYDMGWSGVAVEPSPTLFANLEKNLDGQRVILINKALTVRDEDTIKFYHAPGDFVSTTNESHRKKWQSQVDFKTIEVRAVTWKELEQYGSYDFINIDVEGNNIEIFNAMPAAILENAKLLCIEHDSKIEYLVSALRPKGYHLIHTTSENVIFERKAGR